MLQTFFMSMMAFPLFSCNSYPLNKEKQAMISSNTYDSTSFICFDKNGERKRGYKGIKLGDSINKIKALFDLELKESQTVLTYHLKQPILHQGLHGNCAINLRFEFDREQLLKSVQAIWTYNGNQTNASRNNFSDLVLAHSMTCLWERTLNMYKEKDTIQVKYVNKQVDLFTTDLSNNTWVATYETWLE